MSKETIKIESPNLIEFVYDIERKVKEGYSVDDTNEGLPQSWGPGLYTCTVSKEVADKVEEPVEEPKTESPVEAEEASEEPKQETKPKTRRKKSASKSSKAE